MGSRNITAGLCAACDVALAALAAAVVAHALWVRLPAEIALNYGEGFVQLDALRAARGEPLYGDPAQPPYTLHVYTPLYTWAVAGLLRWTGEGYGAGRALGYAALLATAALLGATGRRPTSWAVAALYLTLPLFAPWGAMVRPDNLAVLLAAGGIVVVERGRSRAALGAAAALFLAAGLSKQTALAGPLAALLVLWGRDRRAALWLAGLLVAGAAVATLALQATSGGWFWTHAVASHLAKPSSAARLAAVWASFLSLHGPVAVAGAALLASSLAGGRPSIYALWLLAALAGTWSAGALGSDTNYFLEPAAALAFLAAHELPAGWARASGAAKRLAALGAGLGAVALAGFHLQVHLANADWIEGAARRQAEVVERLAPVSGTIVSDDAGLLLASGRALWLRPMIMAQAARSGLWDEAPVLRALRRRDVARVILAPAFSGSRYTPAMRAALARHYRVVDRFRLETPYEVWAPRPP